jgi:hypothetical protein
MLLKYLILGIAHVFRTKRQHELAAVNRYIAAARLRGRSHFQKDWHTEDFVPSALDGLVESMVEWCRATTGTCRRPYGINFFDLIITYRLGEDGKSRSFRLNRLEPMALYQDSLPKHLLDKLLKAMTPEQPIKVHISAGFFSWGDAAFKALNATTAQSR